MDILDEMTKAEIVAWLRGQAAYIFRPPKKSDLLFIRWERKTRELSDRDNANIRELESIDLKKRDQLAKQCNAEKNIEKKMYLLKKIGKYYSKVSKNIKASQAIRKEYKKLDKMYDQIDIERKKETVL